MGEIANVLAVFVQIDGQVLVALEILLHLFGIRVRHKDDTVGTLQHELPGRVVVNLTWHRVELKLGPHARNIAKVERHEVEKQSPVSIR